MTTLEDDCKLVAGIYDNLLHYQTFDFEAYRQESINFWQNRLNDSLQKIERRLHSRGKCPNFVLSGVGQFHWSDHPELQTFTFTREKEEIN